MSGYLSSYAGPYLKVKKKTQDSYIEFKICPNENCDRYNKKLTIKTPKFCSECGFEIKDDKEENVKVLEFFEGPITDDSLVDFARYDDMMIPGHHIIIPNWQSLTSKELSSFDKQEDDTISIKYLEQDYKQIFENIEEFKNKNSTSIKLIEDFYGKENVKIHWGIFQSYS